MNDWDQDPKLAKVPSGMPTAPAPTAELLPCPFCGGGAESWDANHTSVQGYEIVCANRKCGASTGMFPTKPMAIRVWNTRQAASVERAEVAGEAVAWRKLGLRILSYFDLNARPENDLAQSYRAELAALLFDASPPRSEGVRASEVQSDDAFSPQDAWDELVDKDDRTSPEEYPDHCLITFDELQDFMIRGAPQPAPVAQASLMRDLLVDLEEACERVAANRPQAVYDAMIYAGKQDDLLALDQARAAARAAIAGSSLPSAQSEGGK